MELDPSGGVYSRSNDEYSRRGLRTILLQGSLNTSQAQTLHQHKFDQNRHFQQTMKVAANLERLEVLNCSTLEQIVIFKAEEALCKLQHIAIFVWYLVNCTL